MFKPTAMFAIPGKPSDDLAEILPKLFEAILLGVPPTGCVCPKCIAKRASDDEEPERTEPTPEPATVQPQRQDVDFGKALLALQLLVPVRRRAWRSEQFILLASDRKSFLRENGSVYRLSAEDILTPDWEPVI